MVQQDLRFRPGILIGQRKQVGGGQAVADALTVADPAPVYCF